VSPGTSLHSAAKERGNENTQAQHYVLVRFGLRVLFVCPIQSATGKRDVAFSTVFGKAPRPLRVRFWFNLAIAMVPAALVCMLLSLYLTRPISRLRATAQRLAGGDLRARGAPTASYATTNSEIWRAIPNVMAAQIQLLITAQRRFVANVSHELGAPLTRMHLALALLRR
jgi:signal transduction histidine kinase